MQLSPLVSWHRDHQCSTCSCSSHLGMENIHNAPLPIKKGCRSVSLFQGEPQMTVSDFGISEEGNL